MAVYAEKMRESRRHLAEVDKGVPLQTPASDRRVVAAAQCALDRHLAGQGSRAAPDLNQTWVQTFLGTVAALNGQAGQTG
jgi:hypothetical protein